LPKVATKSACQDTYWCTWPLNSTSTSAPFWSLLIFSGSLGFCALLSRRNQMAGGSIFLCWFLGGSSVTTAAGSATAAGAGAGAGG
jgi:hypothetical protein